ncbi:MAG: Holliday junction branch migration protein RuvA [Bacteroidales bacterium]|nr:Holliday junction branch migration protein RuvA [Bacteroidales bacterium]
MYEYISGKLTSLNTTQAVIDCGGVGYLLEISLTTFDKIQHLRDTSSPAKLFVHEVIREDAHQIFGFADEIERSLFRLLISVSGVGANTARVMLSTLTAVELSSAIASQDEATIKRIKGIGAKTAQRIVLELHDKVATLGTMSAAVGTSTGMGISISKQEALSAMTMLGFAKSAVEKVLQTLDGSLTAEELIREALKKM